MGIRFLGKRFQGMDTGIKLFFIITAFTGLALGLSDSLLSNYFKEAYEVNAQQRGFIEFPRELPGVLVTIFVGALTFLGNVKISVVAQILSMAAMLVLGLFTPSFSVMLIFLFIYSSGVHMYMPLGDSIGLSLSKGQNMGGWLGRFNGMRMGFVMVAGVLTFIGFRLEWFSFKTPIAVFLLAACFFAIIIVLLLRLNKMIPKAEGAGKFKFVFRKEYTRYYLICALFGGRKQIMLVYSPWVLIELLGFRADRMSILSILGALIGIFFMPMVGKWIDRFGVKKVMMAEALAFVAIYTGYGILSAGLTSNTVVVSALVIAFVYLLNIIDRMTAQFGMVRTLYMRSIALKPEDVTPSLSMGMSIDHIVAIAGSYICGVIWYNWGPQYVFIIAGVLSAANMLVARGIKTVDNEGQPQAG